MRTQIEALKYSLIVQSLKEVKGTQLPVILEILTQRLQLKQTLDHRIERESCQSAVLGVVDRFIEIALQSQPQLFRAAVVVNCQGCLNLSDTSRAFRKSLLSCPRRARGKPVGWHPPRERAVADRPSMSTCCRQSRQLQVMARFQSAHC